MVEPNQQQLVYGAQPQQQAGNNNNQQRINPLLNLQRPFLPQHNQNQQPRQNVVVRQVQNQRTFMINWVHLKAYFEKKKYFVHPQLHQMIPFARDIYAGIKESLPRQASFFLIERCGEEDGPVIRSGIRFEQIRHAKNQIEYLKARTPDIQSNVSTQMNIDGLNYVTRGGLAKILNVVDGLKHQLIDASRGVEVTNFGQIQETDYYSKRLRQQIMVDYSKAEKAQMSKLFMRLAEIITEGKVAEMKTYILLKLAEFKTETFHLRCQYFNYDIEKQQFDLRILVTRKVRITYSHKLNVSAELLWMKLHDNQWYEGVVSNAISMTYVGTIDCVLKDFSQQNGQVSEGDAAPKIQLSVNADLPLPDEMTANMRLVHDVDQFALSEPVQAIKDIIDCYSDEFQAARQPVPIDQFDAEQRADVHKAALALSQAETVDSFFQNIGQLDVQAQLLEKAYMRIMCPICHLIHQVKEMDIYNCGHGVCSNCSFRCRHEGALAEAQGNHVLYNCPNRCKGYGQAGPQVVYRIQAGQMEEHQTEAQSMRNIMRDYIDIRMADVISYLEIIRGTGYDSSDYQQNGQLQIDRLSQGQLVTAMNAAIEFIPQELRAEASQASIAALQARAGNQRRAEFDFPALEIEQEVEMEVQQNLIQ